MRCPKCTCERSSVIDSRSDESAIKRRRECQTCHFRFSTYERIEYSLPMVVKKDGRREPFDREKVRAGLIRACEKRPVSMETVERTIDAIERTLQEKYLKEVLSRVIGEVLMDQLRAIDQVAYVRFASVYREFSDVSQFVDTLESLSGAKRQSVALAESLTETLTETLKEESLGSGTKEFIEAPIEDDLAKGV